MGSVIWIRLEKPTFDLVGVVLSSFGLAGVCVGVALALGSAVGAWRILRGRNRPAFEPVGALHLDPAPPEA